MKTIQVKYIGPISDSGKLVITPVTLFCGRQGSGKSTLAKLISSCLWLEKGLIKGDVTIKYITSYNRFKKELCGYHQLTEFFTPKSFLRYESDSFVFTYSEGRFNVTEKDKDGFLMPKIMYVPAERNFMVAVEHAERIKKLPASLQTLQDEYLRALNAMRGVASLYVNDMNIQYDKLNKVAWIVGDGFKTKANQAASGFQSIAPLVLVSDYLAGMVINDTALAMSVEERNILRREILKIQSNKKYTDEMKTLLLETLNSKLKLDCFWNIVEEPEQNLYPSSQRTVLDVLVKDFNQSTHNGLIITTHSPYILNYLTLNIKAGMMAKKQPNSKDKINKIVPQKSWLNANHVTVYEIQNDGTVSSLKKYDGMPSDDNYLNNALAETNILFDRLLEIENGEN